MKSKNTYTTIIIFFLLFVVVVGVYQYSQRPSPLDAFTLCLKEGGAIFYGAFWCSHCQNQKKLFGRSARLLPYIECSTPDGQAQTRECADKNIEGYPTWEFADGSRQSGEISLKQLAEKTGCELPTN